MHRVVVQARCNDDARAFHEQVSEPFCVSIAEVDPGLCPALARDHVQGPGLGPLED